MDVDFKIFIDQLRNGQTKILEGTFSPEFLQVDEKELKFEKPVIVKGETYLAEDHLVLHLEAETEAFLPCSICNQWVPVEIKLRNVYLTVPKQDIRGAVFDFRELLREEILLEVPPFVECQGACPQRKVLQKYLKQNAADEDEKEGHHRPFANL